MLRWNTSDAFRESSSSSSSTDGYPWEVRKTNCEPLMDLEREVARALLPRPSTRAAMMALLPLPLEPNRKLTRLSKSMRRFEWHMKFIKCTLRIFPHRCSARNVVSSTGTCVYKSIIIINIQQGQNNLTSFHQYSPNSWSHSSDYDCDCCCSCGRSCHCNWWIH